MKILITAGATQTPIDKVRAVVPEFKDQTVTNIFKGKTGREIAKVLSLGGGHEVTLLTSGESFEHELETLRIIKFRTYDELMEKMREEITTGNYDVVIHSAAVSDYKPAGVFRYIPSERIDEDVYTYTLQELDSSGKVGSDHDELYIKMVKTEKIVDKIREPWGFKGILIKFKLQVNMTDEELIRIATKSMQTSDADWIVANCLEWCHERAYVVGRNGKGIHTTRDYLPTMLLNIIETQNLANQRKR